MLPPPTKPGIRRYRLRSHRPTSKQDRPSPSALPSKLVSAGATLGPHSGPADRPMDRTSRDDRPFCPGVQSGRKSMTTRALASAHLRRPHPAPVGQAGGGAGGRRGRDRRDGGQLHDALHHGGGHRGTNQRRLTQQVQPASVRVAPARTAAGQLAVGSGWPKRGPAVGAATTTSATRCAVACLRSSAEVSCGLVVRLPGAAPQP
jgi:hypothetical protein